jgi:hypothetical protein
MKSWTAHRRLVYVKYPFSLLLTIQFASNALNISSQYQHNVWEMVSFQCQPQSSKNSLQGIDAFIPCSFLFSTIRNFWMDDDFLYMSMFTVCARTFNFQALSMTYSFSPEHNFMVSDILPLGVLWSNYFVAFRQWYSVLCFSIASGVILVTDGDKKSWISCIIGWYLIHTHFTVLL